MSSDIAFGFSRALNGAQIAARLTGNALVLRDGDLTIVNTADATKVLAFTLAGNTTGKTLTLAPQQTTNQQLNFPNITATDTLAVLGLAQTFSGAKTFSAALTVSNSTPSTSPTTGSGLLSGGLGVSGNGYFSGVCGSYAASNKMVRLRHDGSNGIMETVTGSGQLFCFSPDNAVVFQAGSAVSLTCVANTAAVIIGGALTIGNATLITTTVSFTNGAAAAAGTIANAPSAGNPTKWIPINDNGTTRYIPAW